MQVKTAIGTLHVWHEGPIRARLIIGDVDVPITDFKLEGGLNDVGAVTVTIPARYLLIDGKPD